MTRLKSLRQVPLLVAGIGTAFTLILAELLKQWTSLRLLTIDVLSFTCGMLCVALLSVPKGEKKARWTGFIWIAGLGYLLLILNALWVH